MKTSVIGEVKNARANTVVKISLSAVRNARFGLAGMIKQENIVR